MYDAVEERQSIAVIVLRPLPTKWCQRRIGQDAANDNYAIDACTLRRNEACRSLPGRAQPAEPPEDAGNRRTSTGARQRIDLEATTGGKVSLALEAHLGA